MPADPDVASGFAGRFLVRVGDERFEDFTVLADASSYARAFQGQRQLTGALALPDAPGIGGFGMSGEAEPWLLVHDDADGHGDWTGFAPADDLEVLGRLARTGGQDPTPVTPADLLDAVMNGRSTGVTFRVKLRKADGLADRIEELPRTGPAR